MSNLYIISLAHVQTIAISTAHAHSVKSFYSSAPRLILCPYACPICASSPQPISIQYPISKLHVQSVYHLYSHVQSDTICTYHVQSDTICTLHVLSEYHILCLFPVSTLSPITTTSALSMFSQSTSYIVHV